MKQLYILFLLPLFLAGCKSTHTVTTGHTADIRRDTVRIVQNISDTLRTTDSTFVYIDRTADTVTVFKYNLRTVYRDRLRIDTLWRSKTDTVRISREIITEKPAKTYPPAWLFISMLVAMLFIGWLMHKADGAEKL